MSAQPVFSSASVSSRELGWKPFPLTASLKISPRVRDTRELRLRLLDHQTKRPRRITAMSPPAMPPARAPALTLLPLDLLEGTSLYAPEGSTRAVCTSLSVAVTVRRKTVGWPLASIDETSVMRVEVLTARVETDDDAAVAGMVTLRPVESVTTTDELEAGGGEET